MYYLVLTKASPSSESYWAAIKPNVFPEVDELFGSFEDIETAQRHKRILQEVVDAELGQASNN